MRALVNKTSGYQWLVAIVLLVGAVVAYKLLAWIWPEAATELQAQYEYRISTPLRYQAMWLISPIFLAVLGISIVLQYFIPADPDQPLFSVHTQTDFFWFFYSSIFAALSRTIVVVWVANFYSQHLDFLTIESAALLPAWARFIFAVLILDLSGWCIHFVNHKVPFLWPFHAVHHQQTHMSFFTNFRIHPLSEFSRSTSTALIFSVFQMSVPTILAFTIFKLFWADFYHANVRLGFGPLRYILVTPQSHRVHHSRDPKHFNSNYGTILSIWDHLFGTQWKESDIYPATGTDDENFPAEKNAWSPFLIFLPIVQVFYPVLVVARMTQKEISKRIPHRG